jgi:hypothetical protein
MEIIYDKPNIISIKYKLKQFYLYLSFKLYKYNFILFIIKLHHEKNQISIL